MFKIVNYKDDMESYVVFLADDKFREDFYARLNMFERSLKYAVSSSNVYNAMEDEIKHMEKEAKFYKDLRKSVSVRYSDTVDMSEIDPKMQQIIDQDISSVKDSRITESIHIKEASELINGH